MDALFKKAVSKIDKEVSDRFGVRLADKVLPSGQSFTTPNAAPLSPRDIFRFRKQRGINLGKRNMVSRYCLN
jgi:hypothetical protein